MEDQDGVVSAKLAAGETAADLLEHDSGGGGGVVDEGDVVDVGGVD